jgi:DNA end-binding protein Ku
VPGHGRTRPGHRRHRAGRERLGLLRPLGDALLLSGLHWSDEIRSPAELAPPATEVTEQKIDSALALMDTLAVEQLADLDTTDHYTKAFHELIAARAEHHTPRPVEAEPSRSSTSWPRWRPPSLRRRSGAASPASGSEATVHEMPAPAKKAAAKKTAKKAPVNNNPGRAKTGREASGIRAAARGPP